MLAGGVLVLSGCGSGVETAGPEAATPGPGNPTPALATHTLVPTAAQAANTATAVATGTPRPPTVSPTATAQQTAQAQQTASKTTRQAQVVLVNTANRAEGVRRAIELLGVNPVRGNRVLVKPNFNSADPAPGSTHLDVLRTLVERMQDMGARSLTLADRSGMGDTRAVMQQKGIPNLARDLGLTTIVLDELDEKQWVAQRSKEYHWAQGYALPRLLLDSECTVQTCNLKTHRFGGHFTLSLKNSVGLAAKTVPGSRYDYMTELHNSRYQRVMIAEINAAYRPALIVMDGVGAFVNGGPDQGTKVSANVVLAGTDRVALDAVGVAILRKFGTTPEVSRGRVFEQEQIARAVELGLGARAPAEIELVTGDAASAAYADKVRPWIT